MISYILTFQVVAVSCVHKMPSRRSFTIKEKAEIITRLKNGENNGTLCKEFKVSHSTISSMWKNRDVILNCFATKSSKMKKNRNSTHQDVENALLKWFKDQKSKTISSLVLREKANYFAIMLGKVDFECSESWIYRFRQRYDISVGKVCGATRVSRNECDNWMKSKKLQDCLNSMKKARLEKVPVAKPTNTDFEQVHEYNMSQETMPNIKTVSYCCFCGEVKNNFPNVIDKPYVESKKTTLTLNELSIELDFNKDSTHKTVCPNCDKKLIEIHDFLKVVKNAQDKISREVQNEGSLNNASEYSNGNIDDNNKAHEDHEETTKGYIPDTGCVNETGTKDKSKYNEEVTSNLNKKRKFSFDLNSYSLLSLYNYNNGSEMDISEIKYEVYNKNQTDPLVETDDESVKHVVHEDNVTIDIKEEMVESTDDSDEEVQKKDAATAVISFQIQDTGDLASNKEGVKLFTLANQMKVTNKIGGRNDVFNELTSECETVGAMPKSELVILVQSIVSQMLNKFF